ncbi:MAG: YraN family protein [Tannerellaceae bacterium]|nr:YraN family protein [Tannerellaceae bacterium]
MAEKHDIGRKGEQLARQYLIRKGYSILHINWHWGHYELDIVARTEDELVIVEVKSRSGDFLTEPEEAVNRTKINRLVAAANAYVRYFKWDLPVRFDIITLKKEGELFEIDHLEDAFYAPVKRRY